MDATSDFSGYHKKPGHVLVVMTLGESHSHIVGEGGPIMFVIALLNPSVLPK